MPGFMPGTTYVQDEITLQKGDVLFMYTDGVTEAENTENVLFTEERLKNRINECECSSSKYILTYMREKIDLFAGGAEQSDDITMLALRIKK
jgi:sigma-B regulation protein RsbU (phosphoserine phosphatase)